MGYKREPRTYRLVFDESEFEGLEVTARSVPVRNFVGLLALATATEGNPTEHMGEIGKLFDGFAGALVSWNLTQTDDGGVEVPIPADLEGVYAQDVDFMLRIISAWLGAIGGVPGPLDGASAGGERSVELSLPMEPSSASPPS